MAFTDRQVRALNRRVPLARIKTRFSEGKELSYIEGWFALDQANRIFGFDGWDRETIEARCVHTHNDRAASVAVYCARVRVTVRTERGTVVRDGHGTGEARATSPGDAHDRALKTAETDATKRALATFGKAFGLALYGGQQAGAAKTRDALIVSPDHEAERVALAGTKATVSASNGHAPEAPASSTVAVEDRRAAASASLGSRGTFLPKGRIDKSALTFSEPKRARDRDHLRYVASQPCVLCSTRPSDAHHIRFAQPRAMGRKVGDEFTVPLCRNHHRELHHEGNEVAWWHDMGIDPLAIARGLWSESQVPEESQAKVTSAANGATAPAR
jgi:hypothetical protein